jgi:hypothetical protein
MMAILKATLQHPMDYPRLALKALDSLTAF